MEDKHYATVGGALLDMLAEVLGKAYTAEVREAWTALYGEVARLMKEGAAQSEASALV